MAVHEQNVSVSDTLSMKGCKFEGTCLIIIIMSPLQAIARSSGTGVIKKSGVYTLLCST